jgi:hypothetical protein
MASSGYSEYAAGWTYNETERGITVTRVFRWDTTSPVAGPDLPKPGEVLDEADVADFYVVPHGVVFTGLICREREWHCLAGDPKKVEWVITYSNEPVDTNVFDTDDSPYTPASIADLPMTLEYSGECVNINPTNAPGSAGWTWEASGTTVVQPIPFKVNSSALKIGPLYISEANYDNFMYASRYLAGKLNDTSNPFGFTSSGGGKGSWLFQSATTEVFRNYVSNKWWRAELDFLFRDPDGTGIDGWQKILRLDGVWDIPKDGSGNNLYTYGNFEALWDFTISPVTEPAP